MNWMAEAGPRPPSPAIESAQTVGEGRARLWEHLLRTHEERRVRLVVVEGSAASEEIAWLSHRAGQMGAAQTFMVRHGTRRAAFWGLQGAVRRELVRVASDDEGLADLAGRGPSQGLAVQLRHAALIRHLAGLASARTVLVAIEQAHLGLDALEFVRALVANPVVGPILCVLGMAEPEQDWTQEAQALVANLRHHAVVQSLDEPAGRQPGGVERWFRQMAKRFAGMPEAHRCALELAAAGGNEVETEDWHALATELGLSVDLDFVVDLIAAGAVHTANLEVSWSFAPGAAEALRHQAQEAGRLGEFCGAWARWMAAHERDPVYVAYAHAHAGNLDEARVAFANAAAGVRARGHRSLAAQLDRFAEGVKAQAAERVERPDVRARAALVAGLRARHLGDLSAAEVHVRLAAELWDYVLAPEAVDAKLWRAYIMMEQGWTDPAALILRACVEQSRSRGDTTRELAARLGALVLATSWQDEREMAEQRQAVDELVRGGAPLLPIAALWQATLKVPTVAPSRHRGWTHQESGVTSPGKGTGS